MTRKNVKLAYITNDSAMKATYKKRKKGLMKKVSELSTLCGINVCAIMYNPYESQPKVWPSPMGVQRVLSKFKAILRWNKLLDENMREIDKRIAALANTPLNPKGALPSLSSSVAALPPMTMVTLEAISRIIIKDMLQTKDYERRHSMRVPHLLSNKYTLMQFGTQSEEGNEEEEDDDDKED
ncbi:hypothetical protein PVK06_028962 [Gossypium arboreum]|uniref:MADS-box domain-containing protein n=1 Tax=Gossypium arboreum TaxID=29729 RepID=A0ABR0P595_GOSAR|nr:hypothetical protein PVK06_028962 [Gossypium arboreum]